MFGGNQGDLRVRRLLETLELKYSIDSDGDYEVIVEFDDGRSQMAYINSETQTIGNFEVREVWSVAYVSQGFLDIDTANTLLMKNYEMKLGSWRLIPAGDNQFLAAFCIKIAADCDPNSLAQTLAIVLEIADDMEEKLTGADDL
jgi:hypothetical protein